MNNLYLTEDYAFCYRARKLGFKTWMSKRFELPHTGTYEFSAEGEQEVLIELEKQGRITINKNASPHYFSAYTRPSKPEFNAEMPDING